MWNLFNASSVSTAIQSQSKSLFQIMGQAWLSVFGKTTTPSVPKASVTGSPIKGGAGGAGTAVPVAVSDPDPPYLVLKVVLFFVVFWLFTAFILKVKGK